MIAWRLSFALAGVLMAAGSAQAEVPAVSAANGNIVCSDAKGRAHTITASGKDDEVVLSPDRHTVAFVRTLVSGQADLDANTSELWIGDCLTGKTRRLLTPRVSDEPKERLSFVNNPVFSLDGGFVYVMARAWETSDAVHQVSVKTGKAKYVIDSNSLAVIRNGPYRGYLLTQPHMYRSNDEGAYDPTYVVRPDGKWKMLVPNTDKGAEIDFTAEWLETHGWKAW